MDFVVALNLVTFLFGTRLGIHLFHAICRCIPIPGCKSVAQVQEHVGAMGWRLESNEIAIIDEKLQTM